MSDVRPLLWKMANRSGRRRLRAWSQNDQYRRGRWLNQGRDRRPAVVGLVESLARGGRVVEHACGQGYLAALVDPGCYESYVGYDISDVAIAAARLQPVSDRCRFEVADLTAWPGEADLSLIVAEECLYYLRPAQQRSFLERCAASLEPGGAILVTFHDAEIHAEAVAACRAFSPDHEVIPDGRGVYLVLRPPAAPDV